MNRYEEFKNYLEVKDFSRVYLSPVRLFLNYCCENNIEPLSISYQQYTSFILSLKKANKKNGYINNFIKGVRCYYNYLLEAGILTDEAIIKTISSFKFLPVAQEIKTFLTLQEVEELISKAITYSYSMSPEKIRALVFFMFYTGLRRDEVINLKRKEISQANRCATVRIPTKNKIERVVFFPPKVAQHLQAYYDTEEEEANAFNISINIVKCLFRHLNFLTPKHISAHTMRHSFANMLARAGIDVRVAQKLLGHKSINSTLIYYDPDKDIIQELYKKNIK